MSKIEDIEKETDEHNESHRKLKDATTKFLALARHLLSFYPMHAKGDAVVKKPEGKGKK